MAGGLRLLLLAAGKLVFLRILCGSNAVGESHDSSMTCAWSSGMSDEQAGSLLQRAALRREGLSSLSEQLANVTNDLKISMSTVMRYAIDQAPCAWIPSKECQSPFVYKGKSYAGCCTIDHPTPWCSHDKAHDGIWSECVLTCFNASSAGLATPSQEEEEAEKKEEDEEIESSGWINRDLNEDLEDVVRDELNDNQDSTEEDPNAKCTAALARFAKMNEINAVRPIEQGHDPFFPAAESSIAPPETNCGDSAHNIHESCSKYNHWFSMDAISQRYGFSFHVFDPANGVPHHTDVDQGQLGTCYFLSAIASIAYRAPSVIDKMFVRREYWDQGILSTKWLINGRESIIEVDKTIPSHPRSLRPFFTKLSSSNGAWWPAIMEKAWSKTFGSYKAAEAGWWHIAAAAITRAPTLKYFHSRVKGDALWMRLVQASAQNWPMGAGTSGTHYGLAAGHAYSVLEAWEDAQGGKLVRIRNPWHSNFYNGSQPNPNISKTGVFTMAFDEYEVSFRSTDVAKVMPSYEVSTLRVRQVDGVIAGKFEFNIQTNKWFAVSLVWPNHRMLCKMPAPVHVLKVQKVGTDTWYDYSIQQRQAYASNAAYVEIPAVPAYDAEDVDTYSVIMSAVFPIDTFIDEVYLNVYSERLLQLQLVSRGVQKT